MAARDWFFIFCLGIGWGLSFMFNAVLLRELGPLSVALGRVGFGALGCWVYLLVTRQFVSLSAGRMLALVGFGALSYAAPFSFYAIGQQDIASGVAGIVNATTPALAVVVSHFWPKVWGGGEQASLLKSLGVVAGFAGIVLLSLPILRTGGGSQIWAVCVTLCAPLCYAFSVNIARQFQGIPPVVIVAWGLSGATLALVPLAVWQEGVPVITRAETWASLAVIGFVLTAAAFILFYNVLPRVGATNITLVTLIAPMSALAAGVLVLGEVFLPAHFAGLALILFGLLLIDGRLFRKRA